MVALALTTGGLQLLLPSSSSHPSPTKDLQLLDVRDNISYAAPQCMSSHPSQPMPGANLPIANLPAKAGGLHEASLPSLGSQGCSECSIPSSAAAGALPTLFLWLCCTQCSLLHPCSEQWCHKAHGLLIWAVLHIASVGLPRVALSLLLRAKLFCSLPSSSIESGNGRAWVVQ